MRQRRSVQIFNFSFVDILATTIGVLLFVLLMAVLSQSGVAAYTKLLRTLEDVEQECTEAAGQVQEAKQDYEAAVEEGKKPPPETEDVLKRAASVEKKNQELADLLDEMQERVEELETQKQEAQERIAEAKDAHPEGAKLMLPKAEGGARATAIHVDCRSNGLVILGTNVQTGKTQRQFCATDDIEKEGSHFRRLVKSVKGQKRRVIVLWVRPDGVAAADKAIEIATEAEAPVGWEPADKNWAF